MGSSPTAVATARLREQGTVPVVGARTPARPETDLAGADVALARSRCERLSEAA
jgi:aryl-alcohol dehydrogenase-like predicted oxidoreductase